MISFPLTKKLFKVRVYCCQVVGNQDWCQESDANVEHNHVFPVWVTSKLFCITQCAHKLPSRHFPAQS